MRINQKFFRNSISLFSLFLAFTLNAQEAGEKWSEEKAWEWYERQEWTPSPGHGFAVSPFVYQCLVRIKNYSSFKLELLYNFKRVTKK